MKISFVIPCYGSEKTLRYVVDEIISAVKARGDTYEIILVNDCSPDNVFGVIQELCGEDSNIKGICLAKNFGQHAALMAGYAQCTGSIIVSADDDGQTPLDETYSLIDKLNSGYDVVYGTYPVKRHSRFRNFGSRINEIMMECLMGKPKGLHMTSFFAARAFVIKECLQYKCAYPYVLGLVLRTTKSIANVPVNHRSRMEGASGYSISKLISLWVNGFTAFSVKPLRIASVTGVLSALIGFIFIVYTVVNKFIHPDVPMGYSSLMAAMLLIGGIIMLILGLIGEYIGRIYICLNNSPQYVIREKINIDPEVNNNERS